MKTKTLLFILLLFSAMVSAQVKRVAILETVDRENKVSYANKLILRANLSKAITQTSGYEAYDRTDVDAIMSEQDFQRTGLVSNDQIKRLGEMTGANYILVAEAVVVDAKNMFITAKLLDVETARTIMTDNVMMGTSADEIQKLISSVDVWTWIEDDRPRQNQLKQAIDGGSTELLVSVYKALYEKQKSLAEDGKKLRAADDRYMKDIEALLVEEFSFSYEIKKDDLVPFIYSETVLTKK